MTLKCIGLNLSGVVCRKVCGANLTMEIAQLLMSLLYAWGLDFEIDKICETKLGLLRPMIPVSFGVISKGGAYSYMINKAVFFYINTIFRVYELTFAYMAKQY